MKLGIMQPYFFPYIGYWQLINAVDRFVLFDDVNYINRGWINRNRIILNGNVHYINLPMKKASQNKHINEIEINTEDLPNTLNKLKEAYRKAPYFDETYIIIERIMNNAQTFNVATFLRDIILGMSDYLGIDTIICESSKLDRDKTLRGEKRIIDICKNFKCDHYINAIGGVSLYRNEAFESEDIKLSFLKTDKIEYKQFDGEFYENLSILDLLMFNSITDVKKMLNKFELINSVEN